MKKTRLIFRGMLPGHLFGPLILVMCMATAVQTVAQTAGAGAVNVWEPLGDGAFDVPEAGYPDVTGPAVCWIAEHDTLVMAPVLTEREARAGIALRKLPIAKPVWEAVPGELPDRLNPDTIDSAKAVVYLPKLKKLLLLKEEWWHSPNKKKQTDGWLLDPVDAKWETIDGSFKMSDNSADFNPGKRLDGRRLPVWGALVYDALNGEAVSIAGGGTWGRVGAEQERVRAGDWIYDEAAKRVRRLVADEAKVPPTARKWYPANCGTWVFSEADKKWSAIQQPMAQQPSGRILPGAAFDSDAGKIVMFGGDDLGRCLGDTWVYDCATRTWSKVSPKGAPQARAAQAMVYVPGQKVVLMAGGYGGGWKALKDVWAYSVDKNEWTQLAVELPANATYAAADYDPARGQVMLALYPNARRNNKKVQVYTLKLDLAKLGPAPAAEALPEEMNYHSFAGRRRTYLPGQWLTDEGAPEDSTKVLAGLKSMPANQWKDLAPPRKPRERNWGMYIYDARIHRAFAWGGGHSAYAGAEISEFHVPINRWREMDDPTNYNPIWLHGMVSGPPGVTFGGWSFLPTHARRSYGVDPLSDSVITYVGDVYSIKHHMFVDNIGVCPGRYGVSTQVAFVTTPHGLYGYSSGLLARANVAESGWDEVAKGGPPNHHESDFLCYDSKRDRIMHFKHQGGDIWVYDFKTATWTEETPAGTKLGRVTGDATYIPEVDSVLLVFAVDKDAPEKLYFYKCAEKKWYTAPSEGDAFAGKNSGARNWSPHWDSELGLVVRITPTGFAQWLNVHAMRLDFKTLELSAP